MVVAVVEEVSVGAAAAADRKFFPLATAGEERLREPRAPCMHACSLLARWWALLGRQLSTMCCGQSFERAPPCD